MKTNDTKMAVQKKLMIMRHAKSSWDDTSLKDFDRPLNDRGNRDAPRMGRYLKELDLIPDFVVSSPALRAHQTITHVAKVTGLDQRSIQWNADLYFQGADAYITSVKSAPDDASIVLIAGHNPTVEQVVSVLSTGSSVRSMTTANIVCFDVSSGSWSDLATDNCKFKWHVGPKDL